VIKRTLNEHKVNAYWLDAATRAIDSAAPCFRSANPLGILSADSAGMEECLMIVF
jgi:hypothetical protein